MERLFTLLEKLFRVTNLFSLVLIKDLKLQNYNKLKFIKVEYGYGQKQKWIDFDIYSSINNFNELTKIN